MSSSASLAIDRALIRLEAAAIAVAMYFILFDEVMHHPALGLPILAFVGMVLIALGQLWTVLLLQVRFPSRRTGKSEALFRLGLTGDRRTSEYFSQLTTAQKLTLLSLAALGFASAAGRISLSIWSESISATLASTTTTSRQARN